VLLYGDGGSMIEITIDGKKIKAIENETILEVARRENIYIPTMCYISKIRPIGSCRLCVVEVEGIDDFVLSCQERVVDGLNITTKSDELYKHRQNIMKLYNVNHPLECGVCDKSGECELQNKTTEFGINQQTFATKDQKRVLADWGLIKYEESLCILCERCVHVCNEVIGDDAIEIKVGGYNSSIIPKGSDVLDCTFCGECISVCPVGALTSTNFKYRANVWELQSIPSACAHCSSACHIYYDVKNNSLFRVKNEFEINTLCGAGRFGYDFANTKGNNQDDLQKCIEAFKSADTIKFSSYITNEEAKILQQLKEKFGYKLINSDALLYQKFLQYFSSTSGRSLYSGSLEGIKESDFIAVFGTRVSTDNPMVRYMITTSYQKFGGEVVYLHPIEDDLLKNVVTQFLKYEAGTEEGVLAILVKSLLEDKKELSSEIKSFFDDLDEGYISAESNIGEEEIERFKSSLNHRKKLSFIVGRDLYTHPRAENIAKILGLLERECNFEVTLIPPQTNSLGVALICDLDEKEGKKSIGYNALGDFIISSSGEGDVNIPALNQQEGTFSNIDKEVVPINVAAHFDGFCLHDIAVQLGVDGKYTIDYTKELPKKSGYLDIDFDSLENGALNRGYKLKVKKVKTKDNIDEIEELDSYDGTLIYLCEPVLQFNYATNSSKILKTKSALIGSKQFSIAAKINDKDKIKISFGDFEIETIYHVDETLKGTAALMPTFDMGIKSEKLNSIYRFNKVKITQVSQ